MKRIASVILWSLMFCTLWAQNVSDHFYAVILSGGRSRLMNHERYWNDCAFLYRTLRHDCHLPQQHIIHWTCAIAQHDEEGNPVFSDQNVDGYISMREAFDPQGRTSCRR